MMPAQEKVQGIVAAVAKRLEEKAAEHRVHLQVTDFNLDDDWLYVVVTPVEVGVRASDHAELMAEIERELRETGVENVLLVPTVAE